MSRPQEFGLGLGGSVSLNLGVQPCRHADPQRDVTPVSADAGVEVEFNPFATITDDDPQHEHEVSQLMFWTVFIYETCGSLKILLDHKLSEKACTESRSACAVSYYARAPEGILEWRDPSVCLSVPWCSYLSYRHAGCLQLSHRRPPEMCGLRTRPRTDVDPPRFFATVELL